MYDFFLGRIDGPEEQAPFTLLREEAAQRADIVKRGYCLAGFTKFAVEYTSLTMREAEAVYNKVNFWNLRQGIFRYRDEN